MKIFEIKTKNGRSFRILCENKRQIKRLNTAVALNHLKGGDNVIVEVSEAMCGINTVSALEDFVFLNGLEPPKGNTFFKGMK